MSFKKKQKIVLINAKTKAVIKYFNTKPITELDYWIYLGKDVIICSEIEKIIGDRIKRISTGEILQDAARTLRKPYIDFIGGLAYKENKIIWMLSSVSEKNTYISNLFLKFCYLETLDQIIKRNPNDICVFCEDLALIRTIQKNFENNMDLEINYIDYASTTELGFFKERLALNNSKILFILNYFLRIFCARLLQILKISGQNIPSNEPVIAIHSWTDQRSFSINGSFSDAYYGNLEKILENNNKNNSFYIIDVLSTIFYPEALKKLSKLKFQWKLFEDFLEFSDIIRACYLAHKRKTEETKDIIFLGREISDLLNAEYTTDRYSNRAEQSALYYFAARKMSQQFSVKTFIYTFENHNWEKMTIEGLRESSPHTKIVGYAHATMNQMELSYSLSVFEKNLIPIPDVILVNGHRTKEILCEFRF